MDEINWRRKTHKHTRARWAHATIQSENQFHLVAAKRIYFRIFFAISFDFIVAQVLL